MNFSDLLKLGFFISLALFATDATAQSAGTYRLITAGTSGQDTGYGSIGTATIKSNKSVQIKIKNSLDSFTQSYSGTVKGDSFTLKGTNTDRKLRIRIVYSSSKLAYGYYTILRGKKTLGGGEYSMTRR